MLSPVNRRFENTAPIWSLVLSCQSFWEHSTRVITELFLQSFLWKHRFHWCFMSVVALKTSMWSLVSSCQSSLWKRRCDHWCFHASRRFENVDVITGVFMSVVALKTSMWSLVLSCQSSLWKRRCDHWCFHVSRRFENVDVITVVFMSVVVLRM